MHLGMSTVRVPELSHFTGDRELPKIFQAQFELNDRSDRMEFEGTMQEIWSRPKLFKPLFFLFYKSGMMISKTGKEIPVKLVIEPQEDTNGVPQLAWKRTFFFLNNDGEVIKQEFNTISSYDQGQDSLMDMIGPGKMLRFQLRLEFDGEKLKILNNRFGLKNPFGILWFPKLLTKLLVGSGGVSQYVDEQDLNTFHMELELKHPLLGGFFGYKGTIHLVNPEETLDQKD